MSLTSQEKYDAPEKDELYDLLSSHRRRYVLHVCKKHDGPVTLSELAEQIAAWEHDKTVEEITSTERKRVYTSLQQTHLDRMAEAGMIRYEGDEIELTDEAEGLDVYLDIVPPQSIPWGVYYLGLSVLGAIVLAGVWVGFVPTGTVPAIGWAALVLMAFLLSSIGQVIQHRRHRLDRFDRPP
ncbi:hypothetical protein JCM18237_30360 [Halorubrum luteum]